MAEYSGILCGMWMQRGEFEAVTDGIRANIDKLERRGDLVSAMKCACYRALIDSLEASLSEIWRHGLLVEKIPVYNFGKVSSGPEAPGAGPGVPGPGAEPAVEKGGGC